MTHLMKTLLAACAFFALSGALFAAEAYASTRTAPAPVPVLQETTPRFAARSTKPIAAPEKRARAEKVRRATARPKGLSIGGVGRKPTRHAGVKKRRKPIYEPDFAGGY